ncbi:MAG TPA: hypothetical protein DCZ71_08110 [Ruminococcus sp.]|nr:hypothetical protein [Ruminococcus sp.]
MGNTVFSSFEINLSPEWVLSRRDDDALPSERIAEKLKDTLSARITDTSLTGCTVVIGMNGDSRDTLRRIAEILTELYPGDKDFFTVEQTGETAVPDKEEDAEKSADEKTGEEDAPAEPETILRKTAKAAADAENSGGKKKTASEKIAELIGAAEFKELVKECAAVAPLLKKYGTLSTFTSRCYLVSINDGCGLSTCLKLFADFLEETGLASFQSQNKTTEVRLGAPGTESQMENPFAAALNCFGERSRSRLVCIDISEWMTKTDDKDFRKFLRTVSSHEGGNIVFFRVPFVERDILHSIHQSLNDLMFVRDLSVVPFSTEELDAFAEKLLKEKGFTMEVEAREMYRERITEEKNDGRFYGINTVSKVINEIIYTKQLSNALSGEDDTVIRASELPGITEGHGRGLTGSEELSALVGMEEIQKKVEEIVAQIIAGKQNESLEVPCIHMRFVGSPGTGKTTVARIIGKILKEKGVLRNGSFFEYSGRDLCGRFVGQTAPKTAAICRDAYGSVLFIDEAYSLYRDDGISTADYGREALDTLVAEMENHRSDFMVIMAGYPDEMEKLMHGNTGLSSRMPYQIDFPNYNREQLGEIFLSMARRSFTFDEGFEAAVKEYFAGLPDSLIERKDFSNARYVRNLYERTWGKAVLRCQMAGEQCRTLTAEDFSLAASEKDFNNINNKKARSIGFI